MPTLAGTSQMPVAQGVKFVSCRGCLASPRQLPRRDKYPTVPFVWDEPYLETCCRSALHRLLLSGTVGRPAGLKDGPCLMRLAAMGLAEDRRGGRYTITESGLRRHAREVLKRPASAQ